MDLNSVCVRLNPDDVKLFDRAVAQLVGPIQVRRGLGASDIFARVWHIWTRLRTQNPGAEFDACLSPEEWSLLQLGVELIIFSDAVGCGVEWSTVSGIPDSEVIAHMRSIQRRVITALSRSPRWFVTLNISPDIGEASIPLGDGWLAGPD